MRHLGYAHLHRHLRLTAIEPERPARLALVTRVTATPAALLVPAQAAPETDEPLAQNLVAGALLPRAHGLRVAGKGTRRPALEVARELVERQHARQQRVDVMRTRNARGPARLL